MIRQSDLTEKMRVYNPNTDAELVDKAYRFAMRAHGDQKRASGDPYFTHPAEVAYMLTDLKLDDATICTALMHDVVEDTDVSVEEIEKEFNKEIATLVDGVTKLGKLEGKSEEVRKAENLRKLIVAMSDDLRVLLVKLADRLHNMRTIHFIGKPEKRQRIAHETLEVYAPLAERIGMRNFKEELQDIAFSVLKEDAYHSIVNRLLFLREQGRPMVDKIKDDLQTLCLEQGLAAEVTGREKKPYSIWKKMERKNIAFEQLSDIMAFRIVVPDIANCYGVLGAVHSSYHMVPGRFKDYISTPKPNGYRSIHTTVITPAGQRVEVQIRTKEMHDFAEYGVAAHWGYKQGRAPETDGKQYRWMRELIELLDQTSNAQDLLENTRMQMYEDHVFCFTPKGDLIELPRNATPVDFAFAVHSQVGLTCIGAKVNGRIVPLRHILQNGDQVEIHRSKTATPSPSWERFVTTAKARSEIRKFIRSQQMEEYITLGEAILDKTFRQEGEQLNDKLVEPALKKLGKKSVKGVYAALGEGSLSRTQVFEAIFPGRKSAGLKKKSLTFPRFRKKATPEKSGAHAIPIKGLIPGMAVHYAGCCHPIPGDRIVGIVATGRGVTIHTIDCETLEHFSNEPERWLDVSWDSEETEGTTYVGRLKALVSHERGALAALANTIAQDGGNINNIKFMVRSPDFFELLMDVEVDDVRHLNNIIAALRARPQVQSIERYRD